MATNQIPGLSPAGADLGLGGVLRDQVGQETEEERRKRLRAMQMQQSGTNMSPAAVSLLGGYGGS